MATITFKGNPLKTVGELPTKGSTAPDFNLAGADLADVGLGKFSGKKKVLNIVPSLDTPVCAISAKAFNEKIGSRGDTVILNISADLPFAQKRFCAAEKVDHVVTLSNFRSPSFGKTYGVEIAEGPLKGLLSRAVVILDANNKVIYTQQVPEIAQEPDYAAAITALG